MWPPAPEAEALVLKPFAQADGGCHSTDGNGLVVVAHLLVVLVEHIELDEEREPRVVAVQLTAPHELCLVHLLTRDRGLEEPVLVATALSAPGPRYSARL